MSEPDSESAQDLSLALSRRRLFTGLTLIPLLAVELPGCGDSSHRTLEKVAELPGAYKPTFFNADEWAFVVAACDRLIPADEHGPGAVGAMAGGRI